MLEEPDFHIFYERIRKSQRNIHLRGCVKIEKLDFRSGEVLSRKWLVCDGEVLGVSSPENELRK